MDINVKRGARPYLLMIDGQPRGISLPILEIYVEIMRNYKPRNVNHVTILSFVSLLRTVWKYINVVMNYGRI